MNFDCIAILLTLAITPKFKKFASCMSEFVNVGRHCYIIKSLNYETTNEFL
jgi:hypothetical protein